MGKLKGADVTSADVARFHDSRSRTPCQANRVLAVLSKALNLAESWGLRLKRTNPLLGRAALSEGRAEALPVACRIRCTRDAPHPSGAWTLAAAALSARQARTPPPGKSADGPGDRLLIFTGARAIAISELRWEYADMDVGRAGLRDSRTGKKVVQLLTPALEVTAKAEHPTYAHLWTPPGKQEGFGLACA